ncbi:MAG: c-type cytochrome biogenesis protein CcmI [Gammaproteobacteria bacterium]|nr:c-type cytochrome biogenesis protein CcmI [Gammaproteobacteria bacterium]
MTVFWMTVVVMVAAAAAFALWPLFRGRSENRAARIRAHSNLAIFEDRLAELDADRDEARINDEEYKVLRSELERSLLGDIDDLTELDAPAPAEPEPSNRGGGLLWAGAVLVPVLALVLYSDWGFSLGYQDELALARELRAVEQRPDGAHDSRQVNQLMDRLDARLAANPEDADGWFLLGRTALNQGEFERAGRAFGRVAGLMPEEPGPLVFQVQALYLADDRRITSRVRERMDRVLELAPGQPIMLEILAMDAFQDGRFGEAAGLFEQVLASGVPEGERRTFLRDGLARSRELAGLPETATAAAGSAVSSPGTIRVQVTMSEAVLSDLPANAAVFVMARPVGGPPMPLAVQRLRPAARLDIELTVDDAMAPEMALDSVEQVEVVARLSRAGTAERGPGDLERMAGPIATSGAAPVRLQLGAEQAAATVPQQPVAAPSAVRVLVEAGEDVSIPPGATLFVFAREVGGPPAPLAVARHQASELPLLLTLDDAMAMTPERTLSSTNRVQIIARVSADGGVAAQPGDLEGVSATLDPGSRGRVVNVLIDRVIE